MPVNAFERLMEAGKRKPAADPPADSENDEPARSSKAPKVKKLAPVKERFDWIIEVKGEDGNGRYFCSICSRDPVLLKAAEGKVEYFTNVGVEKAKDPGRKAEAHASKSSHHSALSRHNIASGNTKSAVQSLQDAALRAFQKSSAEDETYIKEYIKLGLWCASHEIPHTTAYEPLINLVSSYNGELLRWAQVRPANAHYRSKKTISEIIDLCSVVCDERVFQRLINGIERSGRFSLMIDETSLYGQSIMGVFARYVTCRGSIDVAEVREDLVVCCPLTSTKSAIIEETLVRELNDRGFNEAMWAKLGALSCDGAASMSSDNQGLYGRLKSRFGLEKLQFQHCRAHRVNLAAKAVLSSGDHVAIEDAINLTQDLYVYMAKSNKKTELFKKISMEGIVEAGGKHHDKFLKLVEAGGTRWLSHNNSLKRLIRVFVKVAKLLHHISEDRDFDAGERSRASALLERMLYKKTILCICVVSDVLAQLATLTNAFQSREWTLDRAVDLTTSVIGQLDDMLKNESLTGSCDSATKLLDDLRVDEFEVIEKTRKLRGCRTDATTAEETADDHLRKYIEALVAELRRRFSDDCRVIAYLDVFNHPVWKVRVPSVAERFGFDAETLVAESQNIAKHIDLMPSLRAAVTPPATIEGKVNFKRNFWLAFCGDHYSRTMFPEHCKVAAFLLTCPISSSNVERAFSYTTRIDSNIRAALAPETVCKLVRISMQGPSFPGIAQQTWPPEKRSLEQTDAEIDLRDFINEVFDKWFHSRRRINQVVSK